MLYKLIHTELPKPGNIKFLYDPTAITDKHSLINVVFGHELYYFEGSFRTRYLTDTLSHNKLKMMEKGVLRFDKEEGISYQNPLRWSRQGSNLYLEFRKLLFYPLNYETEIKTGAKVIFTK